MLLGFYALSLLSDIFSRIFFNRESKENLGATRLSLFLTVPTINLKNFDRFSKGNIFDLETAYRLNLTYKNFILQIKEWIVALMNVKIALL